MKALFCLLVPVAFLSLSPVNAQSHTVDPALRISGNAPAPGETLALHVHSVYAERPFSVQARSPSHEKFEVASGLTDSVGRVTVQLALVDLPSLRGVDLSVRVLVGEEESSLVRASDWMLLRVASEETVESAEFLLEDSRLPETAAVSDAAEFCDIDGDDDLDVLLAAGASEDDEATYLQILRNDAGDLVEVPELRIPDAEQLPARVIVVADVNEDGAPDFFVAAALTTENNALFLNDGVGHFTKYASFPEKSEEGSLCNAAAFGDFDGDGHLDLFLANGISGGHRGDPVLQRNELLFGDGSGNFVVSEQFLVDDFSNLPALSRGVATGDLDGDGVLDIVVGNSGENFLLVGDGSGEFENHPESWTASTDSTYGVALEDLDLDGDLDIVYANTVFNPFAQAVLFNRGGLQEGTLGEFEVGEFPAPVEGQSPVRLGLLTCDIDADGDVDILYPVHEFGSGEHPDLYLNQGGLQGGDVGAFALDAAFEARSGVYSDLAFGDLDGDGDGDLLLPMSSTFEPELNAPRSYVLQSTVFDSTNAPLAFMRGDANGDFSRDLSDAVFVLTHLFHGGVEPDCLAAADVNGSGNVDLSDSVSLLNHLFQGGPQPAAPYPGFGDAPNSLNVSCERVSVFSQSAE